ncbi:hypothetical protein [Streptomyces sp. NPDC085479]|uniref:hypothetical protein n=1 Tax=Streptomyces sp. NPDC085479 TaxID=3365726 RepID=UPI0037CF1CDF
MISTARGLLRPVLDELDALGPYERRLGALAALAAGNLAHLAVRLGDDDPVVRRYALRGARRRPATDTDFDAAVEAASDDAPAVVRADLARRRYATGVAAALPAAPEARCPPRALTACPGRAR